MDNFLKTHIAHPWWARIFLYCVAFWAGAAVMIIELAATRVLSTLFGSSLYTWTGLIGIILIAMSLGYYAGGWLSDRKPSFTLLAHLLLTAAILTNGIPLLHTFWYNTFITMDIFWGPVIVSTLLLAFPACLLGAVPPYTIRLLSLLSGDHRIGFSAGSLGMISTVGSVIGTFGTGFILIPCLSIKAIFCITAGILGFLSLILYVFFFSKKLSRKKSILCFFVVLALITISTSAPFCYTALPIQNLVFEKTTFYHHIEVLQKPVNNDIETLLRLDIVTQGAQYQKSKEHYSRYTRYWRLIPFLLPHMRTTLFLGAGAFIMPENLLDYYPNTEITVVDIDPEIITVGKRFFRVNDYPRMNIQVNDARRFIQQSHTTYDCIIGDVYSGFYNIPAHLVTKEFFLIIQEKLSSDGFFMMNLISQLSGPNALLFHSTIKTLQSVFPFTYIFPTRPYQLDACQNIIIIASQKDYSASIKDTSRITDEPLLALLKTYLHPSYYTSPDAYLFTDNYNPIEYLIARSIYAYNRHAAQKAATAQHSK